MVRLADPMTQVVILGFVCFCCPAMFNAIGGLGAFGLAAKDAEVGNNANTALGAVFAVSSLAAGGLFNLFGHRWLLLLGGMTYTLYVSSYFAYSFIQSMAFCVAAAGLLGLGAGWLWCAQGAIMMGYPLEGDKGKYFGVFWAIFNSGGVIGNIIPIATQWNENKSEAVSTSTYIIFMCITAFGAFLSLLLLPADKITRADGSPVVRVRFSSAAIEIRGILGLFKDWRMLALFPMFFTSNWFYTYQFTSNALNNISIRTRSFNSALYWGAQIIASLAFGAFLDRPMWTRSTRARYGLVLLTIVLVGTWGGGIAFQSTVGPRTVITDAITGKSTIASSDFHTYDFVDDTAAWFGPFVLYFMYGACDAMFQAYAYWLMGSLTNDINVAARYSGFYKFSQNIGGIFAPQVQNSIVGNTPTDAKNVIGRGMGELLICVALVSVSVLFAIPVVFKAVKDTTVDEEEEEEDVVLDGIEKHEYHHDVKA